MKQNPTLRLVAVVAMAYPSPAWPSSPAGKAAEARLMRAIDVRAPWYVQQALLAEHIRATEGGGAALRQLLTPVSAKEHSDLLESLTALELELSIRRLRAVAGEGVDGAWSTEHAPQRVADFRTVVLESAPSLAKGMNGALDKLRRDAVAGLVGGAVSREEEAKIREAVVRLTDPRATVLTAQLATAEVAVASALSDEGRNVLRELFAVQQESDERTVRFKAAVVQQVGTAVLDFANGSQRGAGLAVADSKVILGELGRLHDAGAELVGTLVARGPALTAGLNTACDQMSRDWKQIVAAVQLGPVNDKLKGRIREVEPFLDRFETMSRTLGGSVPGEPPAITVIASLGKEVMGPQAAVSIDAVLAVGQAKAGYATTAVQVLGVLATKSPEVAAVAQQAGQVAQLMQAVGPLVGLAGMASGAGALAALGGLSGSFGAGSGPDPQVMGALKEIQQTLNRIENKVDQALEKLDAIHAEIKANHDAVMSSLESLGYDVERVRVALMDFIDSQSLTACDSYDGDPTQRTIAVLQECSAGLSRMFHSKTIRRSLSVRLRYESKQGGDSALRYAKKLRSDLAELLTAADDSVHLPSEACSSLRSPLLFAGSLRDRPSLDAVLRSTDVACADVFNVEGFLDPGVLAGVVLHEQRILQLAADTHARTSAGAELRAWWTKNGDTVRRRWQVELELINLAVSQQQLLGGDFLLPYIARGFSEDGVRKRIDTLLEPGTVLADNAVRAWVYRRLADENAGDHRSSFVYSVAHDLKDPWLMREILQPLAGMSIQEASATPGFESQAKLGIRWVACIDAERCFALPTPVQVERGEFRHTSTVRRLLEARSALVDGLEGVTGDSNGRLSTKARVGEVRAAGLAAASRK